MIDDENYIPTVGDIDEMKDELAWEEKSDPDYGVVEQMEEAVRSYVYNCYIESKSAMTNISRRWARYHGRYRGEKTLRGNESPFDMIDPPKLARIVDVHRARTKQVVVPDEQRYDFFRLIPEVELVGEDADPNMERYAQLAEIAISNDLKDSGFITDFNRSLWDYYVLGNMVMMPCYEFMLKNKFERRDNPEYDPTLPPEENYAEEVVNGALVRTPIDRWIYERVTYRETDTPKMRYINPRNVFPTEIDRNNLEECTGVCIYDTCRLTELQEDEILSGGYLYANLDRVKFSDEREDIREVADPYFDREDFSRVSTNSGEATKKLDRITYIGRFVAAEIFDGIEYTGDQLIKFANKFGWEMNKINGWETFIIELVNDGSVMVRMQPSPYFVDKKNIIHCGCFAVPNRTWADGVYDRCIDEETARNSFKRLQLESALKSVCPPVGMVREYFDPKWWQLQEGQLKFRRNMIVPLKQGARISDAIQPLNFNPTVIQIADQTITQFDLDMSEGSHLPPVKMGSATGGATATEIQGMSGNADIMLEEFCKNIESNFLNKVVHWVLMLHHQFSESTRVVSAFNERGEMEFTQIPPEIWTKMYKINMVAFRNYGNRSVMAMNLNEYSKWLQSSGTANIKALATDYGKLLGLPDAAKYYQEPQPPPPTMAENMNASISIKFAELGPDAQLEALKLAGFEVTDIMASQQGAIDAANKLAAQYESSLEGEQLAEMNQSTNGGQPLGSEEQTVAGTRSLEQRQRGLHDEMGVQKSIAQRTRNPLNGRRAQG